ncbi:MAG: FMN-binding protein [bacterium]|nr:FMN-binding protein [bacterium]
MRETLRLGALLAAVCAASGLALGFVQRATQPRIEQAAARELAESLAVVLPGAAGFSGARERPLPGGGSVTFYDGYGADGRIAGYALPAERQGYQSPIRVLVGIATDGTVTGVRVLSQAETPGLGARIEETEAGESLWARIGLLFGGRGGGDAPSPRPWFLEQYAGLRADEIVLRGPAESGKGIHAVTGATITSRALTDAVRDAVGEFMRAGVPEEGRGG